MKSMKSMVASLACLLAAALLAAPPSWAAEADAITVGRIYHIEGDLLRYVAEEKDWVAVVPDAPFGDEDTLFSGSDGQAELIVPNGVWVRIGNSTQVQFIQLDADLAEMDLASGTARFYSKGRAVVKVTSDFGYILADPETIFDVYVGENAIEVVSIKGTVNFVHAGTQGRYAVTAGATSILADPQQISLGDGTVDPDWNRWNMDRENFWQARENVKGPSAEYLPPQLRHEAYTFEENGRWERIPYEGEERWLWAPTTVAVGWSPFTVGRWTDWYGDPTWIPAEPFGYVTHHYGNWVYVRNRWCWAPPVVGIRIGLPLLDIGFFWNPGRVAWIHSGINVGWVPLAPRETYYSRRHWGGRHTVIVNNVNITRININVRNYAHVDHAVIVNRSNFVGRDNYRNVRVTNVNRTTIINQYRAAPVVTDRVVKDYSKSRQRYNFTTAPVLEKPHNVVVNRIEQNRKIVREGRREKGSVLEERVKAMPPGRIDREARVEQPRAANPIVPAKEVNRPKAEVKLPQREIKGGGRGTAPGGPGQPGQPASPAERVRPERQAQPGPAKPRRPRTEPVVPARPEQPGQPAPRTERAVPERPAQPAQPASPADRVRPERPAQPEPATPRTERVPPARPEQPGQPAPRTERAVPERPAQPAQPARPADRMRPERPAQPEPATPRTERAVPERPAQPAQPAQPASPADRVRPERPAQPAPAERVVPRPVQPVQPAQPARPAERMTPSRPAQPVTQPERVAPAKPAPSEQVKPESTPAEPETRGSKSRRREQPDR